MLTFVENLLGTRSTMIFLLGVFVASQTWILATLGETGPDVLKLQTVCMAKPTPKATGDAARQILGAWTSEDVARFQRHYILDKWIHPVLYGLFFLSAIYYDFTKSKTNGKDPDRTALLYRRMTAILIVVGSACDILENLRHSAIRFEPTLEAPDQLLWEACVFASTKWIIMKPLAGWLFWRFFMVPVPKHERQHYTSPVEDLGTDWTGPRSADHLNTPLEAAGLLEVQGRKIPWTLTAQGGYADAERSYVVSPFAHYIGYAIDEVRITLAKAPILECLVLGVVRAVGLVFQLLSFDDCIHFNNLLLSTDLWPNSIEWSSAEVASINQELMSKARASRETNRAIVWRSIDPLSQPRLTNVLSQSGCLMLPARIVNWADYSGEDCDNMIPNKRDFRRDVKLFRKAVGWDVVHQKETPDSENAPYEMASISPEEISQKEAARMADLFHQLYVVKYSKRNPQVTAEGLIRMTRSGFLTVDVLQERKTGQIVGFAACTTKDGVRTSPFVGVDIANDHKKEFYRLMMMMIHCRLMKDGVTKIHLSGGANAFKRHRGAVSAVEYSAVFIDHLPFHRQLPWRLAQRVASKIISVKNAR